jgi:hypothetical protein
VHRPSETKRRDEGCMTTGSWDDGPIYAKIPGAGQGL